MGIWDIFSPKQEAAVNEGQNASPSMPQGAAVQSTNGQVPTETAAAVDPLASFAKMWEKPADSASSSAMVPQAYLDIKPDDISKAAQSVDFTKSIDPALMQKALSGDVQSLVAMMNSVAQNSLAYSVQLNSNLANQAVNKGVQTFETSMSSRVRDISSSEAVYGGDNQALSNPAIRPIVETMRTQFLAANPNASTKEVQTFLGDYMAELSKAFNPQAQQQQQQTPASRNSGDDFSLFLQ